MRIYNMSGSNNSINYILFSMHSYRVPQNCFFFEPMLMNFLKAGNFGLVQVRCPLDIRWVSLNQWPLSEEMCQVSSCDYRRVTIGMNIFFERGPCIFASIFWVAMWSYHRPRTGLLFTSSTTFHNHESDVYWTCCCHSWCWWSLAPVMDRPHLSVGVNQGQTSEA